MLQIIGWLGCLYLLVKGCEIVANKGNRSAEGHLHGGAVIGAGLAFVGAPIFMLLLLAQAGAFERSGRPTMDQNYENLDVNMDLNADYEATNLDDMANNSEQR
jgi:hypothetical protein